MILKERYDEYNSFVLDKGMMQVGAFSHYVGMVYGLVPTLFLILCGFLLDVITKNGQGFAMNSKLLMVNIIFLLIFNGSYYLLRKGFRPLINRLLGYIIVFLNHFVLLYFLSNTISRGDLTLYLIFVGLSFGYLILNTIYQFCVLSYYRGKKLKKEKLKNIVLLPQSCLAILDCVAVFFTGIFLYDSALLIIPYMVMVMITLLYQFYLPMIVYATEGEKLYGKELEGDRYSDSVSSLLKKGSKK